MSVSISGDGSVTGIDQGLNIVGVVTATTLNVGTSVVAAGTTAAPSISPTGDSNTGIFFPSADTVAIAKGGVEALRIDSSGHIGIANSSPKSWGTDIPTIEIKGTATSGGNSTRSGAIAFESGSGTNGYAVLWGQSGGIEIYTSATDRASATYRAKFDSTGNLAFASGNGIDFSATANSSGGTMTSELLNDYEEGTWTPYWSSYDGTNLFVDNTINIVHANYIKINKMIIYSTYFTSDGSFSYNTAGGINGSTPASIGGLPFVSSGYHAGSTGYFTGWTGYDSPGYGYNPMIISNDAVSTLRLQYPSINGVANIGASSLLNANSAIIVSGVYFTS